MITYGKGKKLVLTGFMLFVIGLVSIFFIFIAPREINRETEIVKAEVIKVNYRSAYLTPQYNAATKTSTLVTHPADYDVDIKYNDVTYRLDSFEAYKKCKGLVGETIECEYITVYYNNGSKKTFITIGGYN